MAPENEKTTKPNPADDSPAPQGPQSTVFYDGSCPLCRAEIGLYKRQGASSRFCDISQRVPEDMALSRDTLMKRFHVRRGDGRLVSGAAAFAELWKDTPGWRWLGHVAAVPPFVWIGEGLYRVFLLVRPALQSLTRRLVDGR
ncbi:thiol-disulfide oxidoreductase DCC family protein [Marinicauda pacifica]|jgi:predicted DCC family thiol-disulfide oxidoreductase YuxK|uniref:thiol-disulfide oxidoreductase DCC family protein n=1 Tax=Marinicauda pacifica TaxID=1133559 RepID=UPI0035C86470